MVLKTIAQNQSPPPLRLFLREEEEEINTMTDHIGSDDWPQRRRKGLARLRTAILCVRCRPQLTAGKRGEEQHGDGEVQLNSPPPLLPLLSYLSLHLTCQVLQSAGNGRCDNT